MDVHSHILRRRAALERTRALISRGEAWAMAGLSAAVDAFSLASLRVRTMRLLRAFRLEARPSTTEWAASAALGVLGLATPLAAWVAFDRIAGLADTAGGAWSLALLMAGAVAFITAEVGLRYARAYLTDPAERLRETLCAARALSRLAAAPLDGAVEDGAPARAARLDAAAAFIELRTGGLRRAVLDLPYALVALAAIAAIGHSLVLAPLALVVAVLVLFAASSPWAAEAARARDAHDARSEDFIAECVAHLAVLKGAAMEPFFARRMDQLLASGRDHEWRRVRASDRAEDLGTLLDSAAVLAVAALGGAMSLFGQVSPGALAACILLTTSIVRPMVRVASAARRAAALGPERELEDIDAPAPALRSATRPAALSVNAAIPGVAERVCFEAPFGSITAITARDGALMSAVLRTIGGIDLPRDGEVAFGDTPVATYRAAYPGAVALVTPRAVLMSGTIMENLTLFGQGATEAQALAACDVLGLRPDIDRLPRQLETVIGEGADELSGALAQRLCLARAVAISPRLLLLEEPQARLDPASDRQLASAIASLRGRMSVVIATSRPSYLALAERAYVLDSERLMPIAANDTPGRAARRAGVA